MRSSRGSGREATKSETVIASEELEALADDSLIAELYDTAHEFLDRVPERRRKRVHE